MNLKDFNLLKEDDTNYEIQHPKGKPFKVPKKGLSEKSHATIKALKPVKMAEGGVAPADAASAQQEGVLDKINDFVNGSNAVANNVTAAPLIAPSPDTYDQSGNVIQPGQSAPAVAAPAPAPTAAAPAAAPPQTQAADPLLQNRQDINSLLDQSEKDIENFSKSQSAAAGQASQAWKEYNDAVGQMQSPQDIVDAYKAKDDQLTQAIADGRVDPSRLWNNASTGSKIAAGLAVVLGGFGSAFSGKNEALNSLNEQIGRDIDSQKNDQSNKMNLWKMNREAMGDDMRANLATQNQLLSVAQAKAQQAQTGMTNSAAVLRAKQAVTDIEQQKAANRLRMGLLTQQETGGGQQGLLAADPSMLVPEMVPKEHQAAAFKEIADAKHVAANKQQMMNLWDQAAKENTVLRTGAGLIRTPGSILALNALNDPLIHDEAGRVNEFEANDLKGVLPAPGDMADKLKTKRQAYENYILRKASGTINQGFGINLNRFSGTSAMASPQTKTVNGVVYMRGPNGEAVPVK